MRKSLIFLLIFVIGCNVNTNNPPFLPPVKPWRPPVPSVDPAPVIPSNVRELLELHNQKRAEKGAQPLQLSSDLNKFAQNWAENMARKSRMYHSDLKFVRDGNYRTGGENIAYGQETAEEVVRAWMNSSGHKRNIMNKSFTKVGFGIAYSSKGQAYWCTVFAG